MREHVFSTLPAILAGFLAVSCGAPQPAPISPSPVAGMGRHTGVIVASEDDIITVLIGDQLARIRLEGFAEEGRAVAASVGRRPVPMPEATR
jgi:hypothetical protein